MQLFNLIFFFLLFRIWQLLVFLYESLVESNILAQHGNENEQYHNKIIASQAFVLEKIHCKTSAFYFEISSSTVKSAKIAQELFRLKVRWNYRELSCAHIRPRWQSQNRRTKATLRMANFRSSQRCERSGYVMDKQVGISICFFGWKTMRVKNE